MEYEENIPLTKEDLEKIKKILKTKRFEDFKIHRHYWLNDIVGLPRHDYGLVDLKELFDKTELLTHGFKRKLKKSFGYTLIYKISKNQFVKVCYFFDEVPVGIFNAIPIKRNLEKAILRKYGLRL